MAKDFFAWFFTPWLSNYAWFRNWAGGIWRPVYKDFRGIETTIDFWVREEEEKNAHRNPKRTP